MFKCGTQNAFQPHKLYVLQLLRVLEGIFGKCLHCLLPPIIRMGFPAIEILHILLDNVASSPPVLELVKHILNPDSPVNGCQCRMGLECLRLLQCLFLILRHTVYKLSHSNSPRFFFFSVYSFRPCLVPGHILIVLLLADLPCGSGRAQHAHVVSSPLMQTLLNLLFAPLWPSHFHSKSSLPCGIIQRRTSDKPSCGAPFPP